MTATLAGFTTVSQRKISVDLAKTITVELTLHPAMSQEITVLGKAPAIDVTSTITGASVTAETMESLPFARNYIAVAQVAPGIAIDNYGPMFYGSTSLENEYIINGINVTDVYIGRDNKRVNLDFVQEVEVMSGGLPAEYGRITGGVVNAVTKSGSNQFRGRVFGYTAGGQLESGPKYLNRLSPRFNSYSNVDQQFDYGGSVGGYIFKDGLWFFGAFDRVSERDSQKPITSGPALTSTHLTSNLAAAKVTMVVAANQLFEASLFGDPNATGDGSGNENNHGGNDFVGHYSAVLGPSWNVDALAGRNNETTILTGPGTHVPLVQDFSGAVFTAQGGVGAYQNRRGRRDLAKADAFGALSGRHAIKFGIDAERLESRDSEFVSGGDSITRLCSVSLVNNECPGDAVYYTHSTYINDRSPTFNIIDPTTFASNTLNPIRVHYVIRNESAYVQDAWSAFSGVTINGGVRFERQVLDNGKGEQFLHLDNLSPRLGVVWDPFRNGRSKVFGFFGRFFESLSLALATNFGSNGMSLDVANLDPTPGDFIPNPQAPAYGPPYGQYQTSGFSAREAVDANLKGQYFDEYLIGFDRQLGSGLVLGTKATYRNVGRIIEDTYLDARGGWIVVNPGSGAAKDVEMFSGELVPAPKPVRRNVSAELNVTQRSANIDLFASYVWSRLYGNYEGLYQQSRGEGGVSPNLDAVYDRGDFMINSYGPLFSDRTHQIKAYGSYRLPSGFARGLGIGLATHWYSGTPLTAMSCAQQCFLTARGALGRGPSDYEADLHLGYPIAVSIGRVEILADVFNVLNRQAPTSLDQRFNFFYAPPCGGIPADLCSGGRLKNRPGTTEPLGQIPDPRATAPNPHFMKPDSFTGQRSTRIGARITF